LETPARNGFDQPSPADHGLYDSSASFVSKSIALFLISFADLATRSLTGIVPLLSIVNTNESKMDSSLMALASHSPMQSLHREHSRVVKLIK
jgi:hypothetical protein